MARKKRSMKNDRRRFDFGVGEHDQIRVIGAGKENDSMIIIHFGFTSMIELTHNRAKDLLPLLQHFAETGRLPEPEGGKG